MLFQYYPDTDMLYLKLTDKASVESEEVVTGIVVDFDEDNRVVGIEIEDASASVDLSRLEVLTLPISQLIVNDLVQSRATNPMMERASA